MRRSDPDSILSDSLNETQRYFCGGGGGNLLIGLLSALNVI